MARKKNMPKISVVIPCYNNARFMVQCLDSVVNQTLKDIEIIAINDGSTDETEKIIQEYADVDKRIVFINRKNKGVGYSENEGIKTATGEYVAFLDSDDYYDFKFLENAYNALQGEKLDIVRANRVDFTGSEKHGDYKQAECKHVKDKSYFNKIVNASDKKLFSFANHIWTSIYRRDFLLDNKIFWNEGVSSFNDNGFYFQTLALAETIKYIDVIAVYHRRDNEMSTVKDPDKMFHNFFIEHQFVLEEYKKRNIFEEKKETLIERFYGNYIFAIAVIPFERKFDFIMRASDFFKKMLAENEFDKEKFNNPNVYSKICTYAYLPTEYYNEYIAENYKVSVIVPVFNSEKFLRNTLDCICNQTLKEIEIIFVDDGSTDSSLSIMEEYAKADARITILTQENKGAGAARNLGMQQAHGLYLSFLDADDYFYPTMLKEAFDKGKKENADIVWFKGEEEDFQTKVKKVYSSFFAFDGTRFPNKPVFKFSEISNNPFLSVNGWAWDKLFKRNFIVNKSIKFHEVPITNDAYFTFSALLYAERICTLNKVLISRVIGHEANITLSKHDESPLTQTDELLYIYKMIQEVSLNLTKYWSVKIINSLQWQLANILTNDDSAEIVFDRFAGGYLQEIGIADLDEYEIPELEGRRNNFLFLKRVLEYKPGEFEQFKDSLVNYPITIKTSAGDRELSFLPGRKTGEKIIFRQKAEMGKNTATPFFSITLEKKDWKNCIAQIEFIFLDNNRAAQYDTLYIGAFLRTKNEESEITMYQAQWQCAKKVFAENIFYTVNENTITFFCKYTMSNTGFEYKLRHLTSRDGTGNSILFR
ncbi:MAG: glycosyltransferase, partial [Oscillospiraceae bacterium]|nr:glycosyltransferase [Oscillospiraceae bacterium]